MGALRRSSNLRFLSALRNSGVFPISERARAIRELAQAIRALPKGRKYLLANNLANLATEGDDGQEALGAVPRRSAREFRKALLAPVPISNWQS